MERGTELYLFLDDVVVYVEDLEDWTWKKPLELEGSYTKAAEDKTNIQTQSHS